VKQSRGLNIQQKKLDNQIVRRNNEKVAAIASIGAADKTA